MKKIKASIVILLYLLWPGLSSETFSLFACRDVCGESRLRADVNEPCYVEDGRHSLFAYALGIPMTLVYVIGLPLLALILVIRVQRRSKEQGRELHKMKGHHVFGLFYSAYHPDVWWWEITVALRKIIISLIGVFGGSMGQMQVHLTAYLMVIIMLLTAIVRPFGDHHLLHCLDLFALAAVWMTLWSGSVFNDHPRCENGEGGTLAWCNVLSGVVGVLIILCLVLVLAVIVYYKKKARAAKHKKVLAISSMTKVMPRSKKSLSQNCSEQTLPTQEVLERVQHCNVLFSFGSANGGLKLAKELREALRNMTTDLRWKQPSSAYIDSVDLYDGEGWKRHKDTQIHPLLKNNVQVKDSDGNLIDQITNPHWAEFYYAAMMHTKVVVVLFDSAWHESPWCDGGEQQLFLRHFIETYVDDQQREQQAFQFKLIVVYDSSKLTASRDKMELWRTLNKLEMPQSLLETVKFIPAIIHGEETCIGKKKLDKFVNYCHIHCAQDFSNEESKADVVAKKHIIKARVRMYEEFLRDKALQVELSYPHGHAHWWDERESSKRSLGLQENYSIDSFSSSDDDDDDHEKRSHDRQTLLKVERIVKDADVHRRESIIKINSLAQVQKKLIKKKLAAREHAKNAKTLKDSKEFHNLTDAGRDQIVDIMGHKKITKGTVLCRQGDLADQMYVLTKGTCSVAVNGLEVARLNKFDVFGEAAMFGSGEMNDQRSLRTATVSAEDDVEVLTLTRSWLHKLMDSKIMDKECVERIRETVRQREKKDQTNKKGGDSGKSIRISSKKKDDGEKITEDVQSLTAARTDRADLDDDDEEFHEITCENLTVDGVDYLLDLESKKVYAVESPNNFLGKYDGSNSKIDFDAVDSDDEDDEQ